MEILEDLGNFEGYEVGVDIMDSNKVNGCTGQVEVDVEDQWDIHSEHSSGDDSFYDSENDLSEDDDRSYEQHVTGGQGWENVENWIRQKNALQELSKGCSRHVGEGINDDSGSMNSEDLFSIGTSSDDENERGEVTQFERYRPEIDSVDPIFKIALVFRGKREFKEAIQGHAVKWGKDIKYVKDERNRCRAVCKAKNCSWFVLISLKQGENTWVVKSNNLVHNCGRNFHHRHASPKYLANKYFTDIVLNPKWKLNDFREKVRNDLNVNISRHQASRVKAKVKDMLHGSYSDQYKRLWDYVDELKRSNPGSTVVMDTEANQFKRFYVCLEACKTGFLRGCRKVLGLDGCHLRGPHKGILLSAIGIDGNNCIFPVVYCVAEIENKDSWSFFLNFLCKDLMINDPGEWTFISDRQKGLLPAMGDVLPGVEHRFCVRHMHNNFKKLHSGEALKQLVWKAARANYEEQFNLIMQEMKNLDEAAYLWLVENTNPNQWSRAHFKTKTKCDILLNNMCESFNSAILEAREKPILMLLDNIRYYLMMRMEAKRNWMQTFSGLVCPKVQKKLEEIKEHSKNWVASCAGELKFEVRCRNIGQFVVNLDLYVCSCRKWELSGLPCAHAVAAMAERGDDVEAYVSEWYRPTTYLRAYEHVIGPVNGDDKWPKSSRDPVTPPAEIRLPGRPKKLRIRGPDELAIGQSKKKGSSAGQSKTKKGLRLSKTKAVMHCRLCKTAGHNSRSCQSGAASSSSQRITKVVELDHNDFNESASRVDVVNDLSHSAPMPDSQQNISQQQDLSKKRKHCSVCLMAGHNKQSCQSELGQERRAKLKQPILNKTKTNAI